MAPYIVARCGARLSMFIGAACYTVFIASLIDIIRPVVLVASAVLGFGASILWVAVGGFLTDHSTEAQRGKNTGIFWSLFSTPMRCFRFAWATALTVRLSCVQ
jgi:MFS family permease